MRPQTFALLVATLGALFAYPARAEPSPSLRGLPALNIAALAASDTHLYVGGFDEGLYIVDSTGRARRFENAALSRHINALSWSAATRTLWLGTARGLTRCHFGEAAACSRIGPVSAVHTVLLRTDGSVVAGGDAGLTFVRADELKLVGRKQAAPFRSVWALAESAAGSLFVGASNGLFWGPAHDLLAGDMSRLRRAAVVTGALPDDWVTALLLEGDRLHVGTYNAGTVSFTLTAATLIPTSAERAAGYVNPAGLFQLSPALLAIATMDGLRIGPASATQRLDTRARDVTALVRVSGAGYWLGTRTGLEWLALPQG